MSRVITTLALVKQLSELVDAICSRPPTDDELADVIGHMSRIETKLGTTRRSWERITHELPPIPRSDRTRRVDKNTRAASPTAQGRDFELVPQFKTVRSYNTGAILLAVSEATGWDTWRTMLEARRADAVRWSWRYTDLRNWLRSLGVTVSTGGQETSDDDDVTGPMIGEIKKPNGVKKVYIEAAAVPETSPPDPEPEGADDDRTD